MQFKMKLSIASAQGEIGHRISNVDVCDFKLGNTQLMYIEWERKEERNSVLIGCAMLEQLVSLLVLNASIFNLFSFVEKWKIIKFLEMSVGKMQS